MSNSRIYLNPPETGESEIEQLKSAIESGWVSTVGGALDQFERDLEKLVASRRVLALNSGTSALHLALKLSGIQPGDRVGVSTLTFCASANVVLYEQGIPVFFDSSAGDWNLDPQLLAAYLETNNLHALILTHLYGMPADVVKIRDICYKKGVVLIEDAAESLGARVAGQYTGSFGEFGAFSFNGNKIITTSGGGALVSDQRGYEQGLKWATQSKESDHLAYHHEEVGYNYRLSNILAAIGVAQLNKLKAYLQRKREIHEYYKAHLPGACFDFQRPSNGEVISNYWLTGLVIRRELREKITPTDAIQYLEKHNIESRPFWKPMHLQPLYNLSECIGGEVSETLFNAGFCLPSGVGMTIQDQERVVSVLQELLISRGLLE